MKDDVPLRVIQLTPPGRGAVATLLVEGPGAAGLVQALLRSRGGRPLDWYPPGRLVLGHFELGGPHGEEVVVRRRSQREVLVHCHGGEAAVTRICEVLAQRGCRPASWQQWAAEQAGDPIAFAALVALAEARTERTAAILLDQFCGALRRALEAIDRALAAGDLSAAGDQAGSLLARAPLGAHLVHPWRVVVAGAANVGKSSLINALMGYRRAIVHPAPGTTRDVLTAQAALDGWPVELCDTAGLRDCEHAIEREGVVLARQSMATADLLTLVFDASHAWSPGDAALAAAYPKALLVHNKCDLPSAMATARPAGVRISALTGEGIDVLAGRMAGRLAPDPPGEGAAVPFTEAQAGAIQDVAGLLAENRAAEARHRLAALLAPRG